MFKQYTPMQYLAIDIANHYGLDKLTFEERIDWVKSYIDELEQLVDKADEPELYWKSVNALRKTQQGKPVGHTVALDAVCSGLQLMSVVMNCKDGCEITGLVNPDRRADAYTEITDALNELLEQDLQVSRKHAKEAVMTGLYGSRAVPKRVFGEELLPTFYEVLNSKCTGAMALLNGLLNSWDSEAMYHSYYMPDGHYVKLPSMENIMTRVHIDALNYTPAVRVRVNKPVEFGISNIANVVHSIDAYVLRKLVRRCNYNPVKLKNSLAILQSYTGGKTVKDLGYYDTHLADLTMLEYITKDNVNQLPKELIDKLIHIINMVLAHKPFEVITIHDCFACHANNCNQLRFHYKEILAELAESTLIDSLLKQLYGKAVTDFKVSTSGLSELIRNSNYGLC